MGRRSIVAITLGLVGPMAAWAEETAPRAHAASTAPCHPAPLVVADQMVSSWPRFVGIRVRFLGSVVRAAGGKAIVRTGRRHFLVTLSPGAAWKGEAERTYTVLGPAKAFVAGAPRPLAHLRLEADNCALPQR
jgi:hypothetical protein